MEEIKINENESINGQISLVIQGKKQFALLYGDNKKLLDFIPKNSIDCVITSPPYWKMREYDIEGEYGKYLIGNEDNPDDYVKNVVEIFSKIKQVLKPSGSVWLNIGDKFHNKNLMGMPWRVALAMQDDGWILRNDVIWNQMKGTQSAKDRLRMVHEHIFHFVINKKYYYNNDKILLQHKKLPQIGNGKIISATGVSGIKYRKQILNSTNLNDEERKHALDALDYVLQEIQSGIIVDFRMTIRGEQRTIHSDNGKISGRAKELKDKGYYIMKSHSKGYMPSDIWKIVPEDKWRKDAHYAVFPIELLEIPIKATCPENGIILDPFMGIGSTIVAGIEFGCRGIGIDISKKYINTAKERLSSIQTIIG